MSYLHTRSPLAPRWSRCSCGRRWVWSGSLSWGSVPVRSSGTWAGDQGTAAPSSSPSGGSMSGRPQRRGPPVCPGRSRPCPPTRPHTHAHTHTPTEHGATGLTSSAEKSGSLLKIPTEEASHRAELSGSARRTGAELGVSAGAAPASEANYPGPEVQNRLPGHEFLIQMRLIFW